MEFRTIVDIRRPSFSIGPQAEVLLVGSCFADGLGRKFADEQFLATVNPFGVMYNPASILHSVEKYCSCLREGLGDYLCRKPEVAIMTMGTNHVYRLKETGEIVDNCQKRPQKLFDEEQLSIYSCRQYIEEAITHLRQVSPGVRVILTVSPIRYAKYGFHESQLSKAVLLMAVDEVVGNIGEATYFPAYEIVLDELRDYRFYKEDMVHPSPQAVDYIWERFSDLYLSQEAKQFIKEWHPIKAALGHRPFNPDSDEHKAFVEATRQKIEDLRTRYPRLRPIQYNNV